MYLYESFHYGTPNTYDAFCLNDYSFPYHFHRCYEVISVISGTMNVMVNEHSYSLCTGDTIVIFPNQFHAFHTTTHSEVVFIIFSPEIIQDFSNEYHAFKPYSSVIHDYPISLQTANTNHPYEQKALLYQLCSILAQRPKIKESDVNANNSNQPSLLHTILTYMQKNFQTHCTLQELSQETGYDYSYLSKYFSQKMNMSYTSFLNQLRIQYACTLLENPSLSISDIAFQCGYDTIRTFNRNFISIIGKCPRDYREHH